MKIALIIGISEYDNYQDLPGCKNDTEVITDILSKSSEYDDIKVFKEIVKSSELKQELIDYFDQYKGKTVNEFFLYFTGHGNFHKDEFYYLLSDFDENNRRQTALQNSELDKYIKALNPTLVVKVIDACQSGVSYIKGDDKLLEKYYNSTSDNFNKCYFLHSSLTNQYSYQSTKISAFTERFVQSLLSSSIQPVRYKHIIDFISDKFEVKAEQTPFFVTQAEHTEKFISINKDIEDIINSIAPISNTSKKEPKEDSKEEISYIEIIKNESELYKSEEEVNKLVSSIQENLLSKNLNTDLEELFELSITFENYTLDLPKSKLIANWLKENKHDYFAKAEYEEEVYYEKVAPSPFGGISELMQGQKTIEKTKNVLKGFINTASLPYDWIKITLNPKFPNLNKFSCLIVILVSKKQIQFFWANTSYSETSWTKNYLKTDFNWNNIELLLNDTDDILAHIDKVFEENQNNITGFLKRVYEGK